MPFARPDDITMHYDFAGPRDAPLVVLANALGTNVHLWDDQINALTRKHRVLRYDMRGHGLTDTTPVAARHRQRLDRLVLCATASRMGTPPVWDARIESVERDGVEAVVEATMSRWFTEHTHADRPDLVRGFANMVRRTPEEGYLAGCRAVRDADLRHAVLGIDARTLIVEGAHDPTATPEMGAELRDAIPGAELHVLHSAAHILNAEQPVAFNETVLRFLETP